MRFLLWWIPFWSCLTLSDSRCPTDILVMYRMVLHTEWSEEKFPKQYPEWRPPAQWSVVVVQKERTSFFKGVCTVYFLLYSQANNTYKCCTIFSEETPWGCGSPVVKVSDHVRHVMRSSPVPLKTRRIGQRSTLNLSRAETSSRWCGVVGEGVPA
ncbi:spondin-2 [Trichonephila clavipes]|nr:spondin-2 [Trichonephila clavipes]